MVRLIDNIKDLSSIERPLHLALGVFDGLHIGHQAVIRTVIDAAKSDGGLAGILTFEPHPIRVLAPQLAPRRILASLNHKRDMLSHLGVELMVVVNFTEEFANCEAEDFLQSLLQSAQDLKTLAMGEDWKFGRQRGGDVSLLKNFGQRHDIKIHAVKPVMTDGERVSSTRIRQAIRDGNMRAAAAMLGREYKILGSVVKGRQLGRTIGFPTANLDVYNEQLPADGVWCVEATLKNGKVVDGVANLGLRPTVESGNDVRRSLEVHLLDFSGDLYGEDIEVSFLQHVRPEQKFANLDELQAQIQKDVEFCRNFCKSR